MFHLDRLQHLECFQQANDATKIEIRDKNMKLEKLIFFAPNKSNQNFKINFTSRNVGSVLDGASGSVIH